MPISATSNTVFGITDLTVRSSVANRAEFSVFGLKPSTKHSVTIDGISMNWAIKPWGKDLGDDLISDASGRVRFLLLHELDRENAYALDSIILDGKTSKLSGNPKDGPNFHKTHHTMEISAPDSYASLNIPVKIMVVPGKTNRSDGSSR